MLRGRLIPFSIPFVAPVVLGGVTHTKREGWLLHLTDGEGNEGWGEATPLPGFSTETYAQAGHALQEWLRSLPSDDVPEPPGHPGSLPSVTFAVELALAGLLAARSGASMAESLLGLSPLVHPGRARSGGAESSKAPPTAAHHVLRSSQSINAVVFSVEPMESARTAVENGYRAVKMKVGTGPVEEDIQRVRDVGHLLAGRASLRLDANRAWSFEQAREFADGIRGVHLEYIEEPLADPSRLQEVSLPVALDESLRELEPDELPAGVVAVVLKPTLQGGFRRSRLFADAALARGVQPVVSSCIESSVGLHGLLSFAAGIGRKDVPAGLETGRLFASEVVHPRFVPAPTMDVVTPGPKPA